MKIQKNESLVLIKEEWSSLRYGNIVESSICLKKQPLQEQNDASIIYYKSIDYVIDIEKGRIRRSRQSRIPNWSQNVFYNQINFDHTQYDSYGNSEFTVYVDYEYDDLKHDFDRGTSQTLSPNISRGLSPKFISKLNAAGKVRYVVYGDSISTGAEASIEENKYFNRFADYIRYLYPQCSVEVQMKALGGEDSNGGLKRVDNDVISINPDVVTIAYGMNDLMEALGVDFRGVDLPYIGPRLHDNIENRQVDSMWGIRTKWMEHSSGGYWDFCDFPLINADEEQIAALPMQSPNDFNYDIT